ncbi:NAD(+) synthase [Treponema pectinovorum]|uniref:NAD(+) synthase n=1 Tax=Treponema pectinovorum TaxID=164 RepID=UPI0011C7872F|nr:NAD(+) synthase [Treponema pectinovorum]
MEDFGFLRVAAVSPEVCVADVEKNTRVICNTIDELKEQGVQLAVFPELCITGYTCADLFFQDELLASAKKSLLKILLHADKIAVLVGLPLKAMNGVLYNCAALLCGKTIRIYPKTFVPNYAEFYEKRWFTSYAGEQGLFEYETGGLVKLNTEANGFTGAILGCEICEDAWVSVSPSAISCLNGANVIANLSAGNELIGKSSYRKNLISINSAKNICAYIYANAGVGESTQDLVFSGHSLICENGSVLKEKNPFDESSSYIICDIDLQKINYERRRTETFGQPNLLKKSELKFEEITVASTDFASLKRKVEGKPFVPSSAVECKQRCEEISRLQAWALVKRISHVNAKTVVVGISGGLDSTLALLVCCQAFDILKKDRKEIHAITMPGFGTTGRTYENAKKLALCCGVTLVEISIKECAKKHLEDLNHPLDLYDTTYENAQARERTQVLFDYANMHSGLVLGTGDLSELALGWCTYNGDQMSNYSVNSSIPKTLVRYLVNFYAEESQEKNRVLSKTLNDIISTPVSPELLPPDKDGNIAQKTENSIGSYLLHDFFIYNTLRNGFSPKKIFFLAKAAISQGSLEKFSDEAIIKTMKTFYNRFFSQQFKRSCMSDGVKVGSVSLSPRGDWRMPSDASAKLWLDAVEELEKEILKS